MAAPTHLRERHLLLAYMLIGGASNRQCAEKLGYTESRVSVIKTSPLFQAYLGEIRRDMEEQAVTDIGAWLREQTKPTLDRLEYLRDQDDELGVAMAAVKEILSRTSPVVTKTQDERTVKILIGADDRRVMQAALVEDAGGDDEVLTMARGVDGAYQSGASLPAPPIRVQTLDEALAELREADR